MVRERVVEAISAGGFANDVVVDELFERTQQLLRRPSADVAGEFDVETRTDAALEHMEETFALELTHGYVKPIQVDSNVGLIAVVGEGMRGTPGLAGRIFTVISRHKTNIIAIAHGYPAS